MNATFPKTINEWEKIISRDLSKIGRSELSRSGVLLPILPSVLGWEAFKISMQNEWNNVRINPETFPFTLVVFYACVAFFEYGDVSFWDAFSVSVGDQELKQKNRTIKLNESYSSICKKMGLTIKGKTNNAFVGSAVWHIGVPLSFWEDFIKVCNWALITSTWQSLPDTDWELTMKRLVGGRKRLLRFVTQDRLEASQMLIEMLEARDLLSNDESLTTADAKQVCFLRSEYFDYVPETATFLRPVFPDSLLAERPELFWKANERSLKLHLPGIDNEKLPAVWRVGDLEKKAEVNAHEFKLDSLAFKRFIDLDLESKLGKQTMTMFGAYDWSLFDEEYDGRLVARTRRQLPLHSYSLLSPAPLQNLEMEGFDDEDLRKNEPISLNDRSICYRTKLYPVERVAKIKFMPGNNQVEIKFCTQSTIEAYCFAGWRKEAICCEHYNGALVLDKLPLIALAIPHGQFDNPLQVLQTDFSVLAGDADASGSWMELDEGQFEDKKLFSWKWGNLPISEVKPGKVTSFKDLGLLKKPIRLKGSCTFKVVARKYGFSAGFRVELSGRKEELHQKFNDLPGKYAPLILLAQQPSGMLWDELLAAKDIICPKERLEASVLRRYQREGILIKERRRWCFHESRATFTTLDGRLYLDFCGNPTIIWSLLKKMIHLLSPMDIPSIEVVHTRGIPPFLKTRWPLSSSRELKKILVNRSVSVRESLWNN